MCIPNRLAFRLVLWTKRIYHKYSLSHVLLLVCYSCFLVASATAFFLIESLHSDSFRRDWQAQVANERTHFIEKELLPQIFNNSRLLLYIHGQKSQLLVSLVDERLSSYEHHLRHRPPMPTLPCTFVNSLLFVFSTCTTIGWGYIYPVTYAGRCLSIVVALFGIPFTIIVIKDLAYLLAQLLNIPCHLLTTIWAAFRFCTLRPVEEGELERRLYGAHDPQCDFRIDNSNRLLSIPVTVAILAVVGWLAMGCFLVQSHQPHLPTSTALYFIVNSLATIGVGDVDTTDDPVALLLLFLYLLIGLSIVSLFVNLLHSKFSRAYWLPGRMYAPLRPCGLGGDKGALASLDEFIDELGVSDCPINHYTTLGIIQTDDKCPLIGMSRREHALVDTQAQTDDTKPCSLPARPSPDAVFIRPNLRDSRDDVHDLLVETYGTRPARIITRAIS